MKTFISILAALAFSSLGFGQASVTRNGLLIQQIGLTADAFKTTGVTTSSGSNITTANAMGALAIDVTKYLNTKTISADQTFTFSGTPATAQTWFALLVTNSDAVAHTLTIPSSFSISINTARTSVSIPGSGKMLLTWQYDGSAYNIYGDPVATTGSGSYVLATAPAISAAVLTSPTITTGVVPTSNDGAALGSTTNQFSDLFLAEGGVINWDNGDATITQSGNDITVAGITTFGVGTSTAVTLGTIEVGAASDTTIARAAAGRVSIEGSVVGAAVVSGTFTTPITTNPLTLTATDCYGFILDYGATGTINLPAGVAGMNGIIYNTGAFTITIDPNGSEVVVRDGTAQTGGVSFTLSSGAGNYVAIYFNGTQWQTLGYKGTLAQGS